jgi:protein-disulfide isomerase
MNEKKLFIGAGLLFVLTFVAAVAIFQKQQSTEQESRVSGAHAALHRDGAPSKGADDAKVTIVEFFDPACGTCSQFYPLVNQLMDEYPGRVRVVMRYAPLHQGSEAVVKMLEAAHLQGRFWPALERLFGSQQRWVVQHVSQPERALALLSALNLDQEQLEIDYRSAPVNAAVQRDIQDGKSLDVRATPEFYVNGQPLPSFGYQQLRDLVEEALAEAY